MAINDPEKLDGAHLLLVDGNSYIHRAYHAMPSLRADLSDPDSNPYGAIKGVVKMLRSIRRNIPTKLAGVVFDSLVPNFRYELYPQYKAGRNKTPDDLKAQVLPIRDITSMLGWPVIVVDGIEADDTIATLTRVVADKGLKVIISSGDKDMMQLVRENVVVVDTMSGHVKDKDYIKERYGVTPEQMIDWQTMVGDTADNVRGVFNVGPKTAASLLSKYRTLENIISHIDVLDDNIRDNFKKSLEWLPLSKTLVTMKKDCDLSSHIPKLSSLTLSEPKYDDLAVYFKEFGLTQQQTKGWIY